MGKYKIYHVPGVKIGCTCDLERRMSDQGFTNWVILEEHDCMFIASRKSTIR